MYFDQWKEWLGSATIHKRRVQPATTAEPEHHGNGDPRASSRYPYWAPVTVTLPELKAHHLAFCRDLSTRGIGLLHPYPLEVGQSVVTTIRHRDATRDRLEAEVKWRRKIADGWYVSGSRFLRQTAGLSLIERARASWREDRRSVRRIPFFCLARISLPESPATGFSAFTLNLSRDGICLLHLMPLSLRELVVHVRLGDDEIALRTVIQWCMDRGHGCYMSAGRFVEAQYELFASIRDFAKRNHGDFVPGRQRHSQASTEA